MNSAVVVERLPVNDLVHRVPVCLEFPAVQTTYFEACPEAEGEQATRKTVRHPERGY